MSFSVQLGGRSLRTNRVLIWISETGDQQSGLLARFGDDPEHTAEWHEQTSSIYEADWTAGSLAHRELAKMRRAVDLAEMAPALEPSDVDEHERLAHDTSSSMKVRADHYIAAEQARERLDHAEVQVSFKDVNEVGRILLSCDLIEGLWGLHPDQHDHMARAGVPEDIRAGHRALAAMRRAVDRAMTTDRHWMSSVDHLAIASETTSPFARRALHYVAHLHARDAEERAGKHYAYTSTETRLLVRPKAGDEQLFEIAVTELAGQASLSIEVPTDREALKSLLQTLARAGGHEDLLNIRHGAQPSSRADREEAHKARRSGSNRRSTRSVVSVRDMAGAELHRRPSMTEVPPAAITATPDAISSPGISLERLASALAAAKIHAAECAPDADLCSCWVEHLQL